MDEKTYPKFSFDAAKVIIYGGGGLSKMIIESVRVLGCIGCGHHWRQHGKGTDVIGSPVWAVLMSARLSTGCPRRG